MATMVTNGMFPHAGDIHIPCYQDPWSVAHSFFSVYLSRVSYGSVTNKEGLCVRSQYIRQNVNNRTAWRTLDFYLANDASTDLKLEKSPSNLTLSINIALDAHVKGLLGVNVTSTLPNIANVVFLGVNTSDPCNTGKYEFNVLYGDNRCLLLETRKSEFSSPFTSSTERFCSLWIPERDIENPLQCCVFLFHILCGHSVEVFSKSCIKERTYPW
ncbi:hypothetical protein MRX96_049114 [Rhipicephalus microplus]